MIEDGPCPFCERIAAHEVEETQHFDVVTFEPLYPVTPGHRLFVPRQHVADFRTSPTLLGTVMTQAAIWAGIVDANLIVSAGAAATQTVPHLHVHLVPRYLHDGLHLPWTGQQR